MLGFLSNLFSKRSRNRGFGRRVGAPMSALAHRVGRRNGLLSLGSIAMIAAPFIVNKVRARRAQRSMAY